MKLLCAVERETNRDAEKDMNMKYGWCGFARNGSTQCGLNIVVDLLECDLLGVSLLKSVEDVALLLEVDI
jgi:hypothetical protein